MDNHADLNELAPPHLYVLKGLHAADIIHKHAAVSSSVECSSQGLISLLASSIPDLQSDNSPIDRDFLVTEVGAYCWFEGFSVS